MAGVHVHCHHCGHRFDAPSGASHTRCPKCDGRVTLTEQRTRPESLLADAPKPLADARIGQVFGHYKLTAFIGGGGMGSVYEAERVSGSGPERVALKVLAPAFADDPDFVARFRREADALIRLRHPQLIEVYEKGEHTPSEGGPTAYYFVMERFAGVDLRRYAAQQPISVATAIAIISQAADGLAFAHQHGVVHRDIKPGNILVHGDPAQGGQVKVVDFGVAQLASSGQTLTNLTRSDLILGTLNYMSPEQRLDASRIDHRADVYALAVVAYELLTGSLPLGAFEPASELRPGLPRATDRALLAALRRDPEQRPNSVQQFSLALSRAAHPPRAGRGAWWGAAALVLAGAGAWFVAPSRGPTEPQTVTVSKAVTKGAEPGATHSASVAASVPRFVPGPGFETLSRLMAADGAYVQGQVIEAPKTKARAVMKPKVSKLPSKKDSLLKAK